MHRVTARLRPNHAIPQAVAGSNYVDGVNQPVRVRIRRGRRAASDAELEVQVGEVPGDRLLTEHELLGDRTVGQTAGDELQDL